MTDMSKMKLAVGLVVSLSAIALLSPPAFAEFSSTATTGKVTVKEATFEGGGLTGICKGQEGQWKLPKSPSLKEILLIQGSKNCLVKSVEFKEIEATTSSCELELTSRSKGITKEAEVTVTIVTSCTSSFKILGITCEIKAEPEGNKELKKAHATNEGSNISFISELESTTDKLGGTCPGIKPTKEGKDKNNGLLEGEKLI
jgi:hypothetical protein